MDRAKEGLFNILQNRFDLDTIQVLDLFAGSGSISYEFCSRGNATVTAVEKNPTLSSFIQRKAEEMGMEHLRVVKADALKYLDRCTTTFDLIFADPPYGDHRLYEGVLDRVMKKGLLNKGGCMILEHDEGLNFDEQEGYEHTRDIGNARFSFFVH